MEKTKNGITEGVIWKQLLLFFFPILIGTFFQQLYNTVDTIIVGQFVGTEALAAVGTTGTVINLLVGDDSIAADQRRAFDDPPDGHAGSIPCGAAQNSLSQGHSKECGPHRLAGRLAVCDVFILEYPHSGEHQQFWHDGYRGLGGHRQD